MSAAQAKRSSQKKVPRAKRSKGPCPITYYSSKNSQPLIAAPKLPVIDRTLALSPCARGIKWYLDNAMK